MLLRVEGLTLDAVYESFVRQVAGERLEEAGAAESLQDAVEMYFNKRFFDRFFTAVVSFHNGRFKGENPQFRHLQVHFSARC